MGIAGDVFKSEGEPLSGRLNGIPLKASPQICLLVVKVYVSLPNLCKSGHRDRRELGRLRQILMKKVERMNKVILSGRLTRDVEMKTGNNTVFARTGIAVNRPMKTKEIDFFNLVAFGKTAEFMDKYCQKGTKLIVDGHLNFSQYEDKQGNKKSSVSVIVDNVEFAETKAESKNNQSRGDDVFGGVPVEEDYPF